MLLLPSNFNVEEGTVHNCSFCLHLFSIFCLLQFTNNCLLFPSNKTVVAQSCDRILSYLPVLFTRMEVHALFSHMISSVHIGLEAMHIFLSALLPAPLLSKSYISTFYHFMVVVDERITAWFPMYIHSYSGKLILSFCSNSI